jgi:hypothetical protein
MTSPFQPNEAVEIPPCPICGGKLEVVYDRYHQHVAVCADCMTGLTIPAKAWAVRAQKRMQKKDFGKTG